MNQKNDDFFNGIGLGVGIIITGIALPLLFPNKTIMTIAIFLISFGMAGFGVELEKAYADSGYTNIFIGFGFLFLGLSLLTLFFNVFTKILFLLLLLVSFYVIISGGLKLWYSSKRSSIKQNKLNNKDTNNNLKLILSIIMALSGFISNIVTIISFFL